MKCSKERLSTKTSHMWTMKLESQFTPLTKMNLKWIIDFAITPESINYIEDENWWNIYIALYIEVSSIIQCHWPRKWLKITKLRSFCTSKDQWPELKHTHRLWEYTWPSSFHRGLINICKEYTHILCIPCY